MRIIKKVHFQRWLATGLLLGATGAAPLSAVALSLPPGTLLASSSSNHLILSFASTSPELYTVQMCPDLQSPWTNLSPGIPGDGTVQTVAETNAFVGGQGFYRLLIQTPASLVLPQATAFTMLGHSCGGIEEKAYVTGFDPTNGYPTGNVYLSTSCSSGGRGSHPATFTAWAAVTWDFAGNVVAAMAVSNAVAVYPAFTATDAGGDTIYNAGAAAYLVVPLPAAPTGVTAVQSGDQFQVSWLPQGVNPAAITATTVSATPVNSTAPSLTITVAGRADNGILSGLQPQTTYQITVVDTTLGGSGPASAPLQISTIPATVPPSAPAGIAARWANLDPTGTADTLVATWSAADPGNSPIDQYLVTIMGSDGAGTFTQTVSGSTLTADFNVDDIPNWSVTVQAHNAFGWGPVSGIVTLGGL